MLRLGLRWAMPPVLIAAGLTMIGATLGDAAIVGSATPAGASAVETARDQAATQEASGASYAGGGGYSSVPYAGY